MEKIIKLTITSKDLYVEFDGHNPELGNFNCSHGSVKRITKLLKEFGADKVFFGIAQSRLIDGIKKLKQICLHAGYYLKDGDVENIYRVPEGNGLYRCMHGDCHRIFMVSNFELNQRQIKGWTSKICPCCGKRTRVIPSF